MDKLNKLYEEYKTFLQAKEQIDIWRAELQEDYERCIQNFKDNNSDRYGAIEDFDLKLKELDTALREEAVAAYEQTGDKNPAEFVSIRITKQISYDDKKAVDWAISHNMPNLLATKKAAFKKQAQLVDLPFVEITEKPTAVIKK